MAWKLAFPPFSSRSAGTNPVLCTHFPCPEKVLVTGSWPQTHHLWESSWKINVRRGLLSGAVLRALHLTPMSLSLLFWVLLCDSYVRPWSNAPCVCIAIAHLAYERNCTFVSLNPSCKPVSGMIWPSRSLQAPFGFRGPG